MKIGALILGLPLFGFIGAAQAEVITFDNLKTNSSGYLLSIPNGYAGLDWSNFGLVDASLYLCPAGAACGHTGYTNGTVSAPNVAYDPSLTRPSEFYSASPFTLESLYLTAAWNNDLNVAFTGKLNGVTKDTVSFTVSTYGSTLETLDWADINQVFIAVSGGTNAGYYTGIPTNGAREFALDNIAIAQTPLPAALPLFVGGLGAMGLLGRRRKRKNSAPIAVC